MSEVEKFFFSLLGNFIPPTAIDTCSFEGRGDRDRYSITIVGKISQLTVTFAKISDRYYSIKVDGKHHLPPGHCSLLVNGLIDTQDRQFFG